MPIHPAAGPDPAIALALEALEEASCSADVRAIQQRFEDRIIRAAWAQLPPVQRAALLLARYSQGSIAHELDDSQF